jgi:hypothetical protein
LSKYDDSHRIFTSSGSKVHDERICSLVDLVTKVSSNQANGGLKDFLLGLEPQIIQEYDKFLQILQMAYAIQNE